MVDAFIQPAGEGKGRGLFHRRRANRQGTQAFAQGRRQVFRLLGRAGIHHQHTVLGRQVGKAAAVAGKGLGQHFQHDLFFDLFFFFLANFAALFHFNGFGPLFHGFLDHRARQNLFFLAQGNQVIAVGAVYQLIAMLAQRWNPALAGGFLWAARFESIGLKLLFQCFGGDIKRLGKSENPGVAEPHGSESLLEAVGTKRRAMIRLPPVAVK